MKFLITFREIFMSKTMELATISTQRGFTNGAAEVLFCKCICKREVFIQPLHYLVCMLSFLKTKPTEDSEEIFLRITGDKGEKTMSEKQKYYITTAIAYTSGKPHIGNTYEIVLADALPVIREVRV